MDKIELTKDQLELLLKTVHETLIKDVDVELERLTEDLSYEDVFRTHDIGHSEITKALFRPVENDAKRKNDVIAKAIVDFLATNSD